MKRTVVLVGACLGEGVAPESAGGEDAGVEEVRRAGDGVGAWVTVDPSDRLAGLGGEGLGGVEFRVGGGASSVWDGDVHVSGGDGEESGLRGAGKEPDEEASEDEAEDEETDDAGAGNGSGGQASRCLRPDGAEALGAIDEGCDDGGEDGDATYKTDCISCLDQAFCCARALQKKKEDAACHRGDVAGPGSSPDPKCRGEEEDEEGDEDDDEVGRASGCEAEYDQVVEEEEGAVDEADDRDNDIQGST